MKTFTRLLFFSLLLISTQIDAQINVTLSGEVLGSDGSPLATGNVLALDPRDSSLLRGDLIVDGAFLLTNIDRRDILLRITALGYEEHYEQIEVSTTTNHLVLDRLVLTSSMLVEVEVTARQAMVEQQDGQLNVQVENTSLREAGTALDVLQSAPKVLVDRNGQVQLLGKGTALVYLNGQLIPSTQVLGTINSNTLKRIEIIENPSAKYDASGNAVINIVTKRKTLDGYQLGLLQRIGYGKFFRSYVQANGHYQADRLSMQASYGIRPWTWGGRNSQTRTLTTDPTYTEIDNYFVQRNQRLDHDLSWRASYQLAPSLQAHALYNGAIITGDKDADNWRTAIGQTAPDFRITSVITGNYQHANHTYGLSLQQSLDTLGSKVVLAGQYATFDLQRTEDNNQQFLSEGTYMDINRRSDNLNNIAIRTLQLDYQQVLSSHWQWENGAKFVRVTNTSELLFEGQDTDGNFQLIPDFSNGFDYSEQIFAAYSDLRWQHNNWRFSTGVRGEWTQQSGVSQQTQGEQSLVREYFNVFPSATLRQQVQDDISWDINYSYRINRPSFQDLNPYVFFVDSLIVLRGNPNLLPEYAHSVGGNLQWQQWNLALNYTHNRNKINQIFRSLDPNNPEVISFVKENLLHTALYSAALSRPISYRKLQAYLMLGVFYDDHQIQDIEGVLSNRRWGGFIQFNQSVQLPWSLKLDTYLKYTTSRVDGPYTDNPISFLNLSLSRKCWDNRLLVTLWANDIFDKFKFTGRTRFNQMEATYLSEGDWQFVRLSLNWNFGKLDGASPGGKKISTSELGRINPSL